MPKKAPGFILLLTLASLAAWSQDISDIKLKESLAHDSSYYTDYSKRLTARVYFDRRYTSLKLQAPNNGPLLKYKTNTLFNIGVGATYRLFTLNLGFGLNSLREGNGKGVTHSLNLQSQWYGRSLIIDLFGQFYRGYYLSPQGYGTSDGTGYYIRPELHVNVVGVAAYHMLNDREFSYRSVILQNEWQKKSAGSFLVGGAAYYGVVKDDSSFVPKSLDSTFFNKGIHRFSYFKIGPGIGYAYTYVFQKNYFLTGSISGSIDFNYTQEEGTVDHASKATVKPNFIYRLAGGYNNAFWNVSLSWVTNDLHMPGGYSSYSYIVSAGSLRLTVAKRFKPGKSMKKTLKPLDNLIEEPVTPKKNG